MAIAISAGAPLDGLDNSRDCTRSLVEGIAGNAASSASFKQRQDCAAALQDVLGLEIGTMQQSRLQAPRCSDDSQGRQAMCLRGTMTCAFCSCPATRAPTPVVLLVAAAATCFLPPRQAVMRDASLRLDLAGYRKETPLPVETTGLTGMGGGRSKTPSPSLNEGSVLVSRGLPQEVVRRIVRQNFGRFRQCYEAGLRKDPDLAGVVTVAFDIDGSGAVVSKADRGSHMKDKAVIACVVRAFDNFTFPKHESGLVHVIYPIAFAPPQS